MERRGRLPDLVAAVDADARAAAARPSPPTPTTNEVKPMALTGEQYEALSNALLAAFPTPNDLERMVRFKLNRNLYAIAGGGNHGDTVFELIGKAEAEGWIGALLEGARAANPGNPLLAGFVVNYGLGSVRVEAEGALELMLKQELPLLDFKDWLAKWTQLEPRVCRVELPLAGNAAGECGPGAACGTGFLVGKDLILTAYHVVEPLIEWEKRRDDNKTWARSEDVRLRFDYAKREGEAAVHEGTIFKLDAMKWDVVLSPYSQADYTTDKLPAAGELDFALVRVAGAPGDQPVGGKGGPGAVKRGWLDLSAQPSWPVKDTAMYILQHPHGKPLKMAPPDRIIGLNGNKTRVRYRVNTEKGSSGSPCFSSTLEPIALHHSGDPAYGLGQAAEYNQGVPLAAIAPVILPHL
jgi:V8-like Glu-specific endopeptidase